VVSRASSKARRPINHYDQSQSDIYKEFVPRLDNVDIDKDYSIRRPDVNIESTLY